MIYFIWPLIPLGAFLWRIRGGMIQDITGVANWHGFNDTAIRFAWAIGMGGAYALLGGIWPLHLAWYFGLPLLIAMLFAGTTLIGWFGVDADLDHLSLEQMALASLSGVLRMALLAVGLLSPYPIAAGILCGPIYLLASKLPSPQKWMVWSEFAFGGAIGLSMACAALWPL
jgi:hypothetical protein